MNNNFFIVIPSYKRSNIIVKKTLHLCCIKYNIPQEQIYIFVLEEDFNDYKHILDKFNYQNINLISAINDTAPGLHNMRNFITNYFDEDVPLLHIDDDIDDLYKLHEDISIENKNKSAHWQLISLNSNEFIDFINNSFSNLKKHGLSLFGIYPVKNGFFMKDLPERTYDLRFCVGAFWGCFNKKDIQITLEEKEDFERTILFYILSGGVLRNNHITLKTKYYSTKGGMQSRNIDRVLESQKSCAILCEKYPNFCRLYSSKKNGMCEVRLKNK